MAGESSTTAEQYAAELIKEFEGCRLQAYPDPATGGTPWTIGYGATGPGIEKGVTWTQQQADDRLVSDMGKFMAGVRRLVLVKLQPNELGALTSFAYNVGLRKFERSTLLRLLNAGNKQAAAGQFKSWVMADGKVLQGLVRRRGAERAVFEGEQA